MQFGKYRLLEKIGQGGMAEVFYAHILGSEGFTKEVALKRVLSHLCEDEDFVKSFVDEARLGGLLNHHHIVQTLDFGQENGIYYIAMEYVHGLTLREILNYHNKNKLTIPPPVVLELILQLSDGLRYAHKAEDEAGNPLQMVHRDLKPTNILVSSHGVVKIADFGIARAETNIRRTVLDGVLKGTAQYMSPEQAMGDLRIDRRSDIFSLGSISFELITQKPLFYDASSSIRTLRNVQDAKVDDKLAKMAEKSPYARPMLPILSQMLARNPADRPSQINQLMPALRRIHANISRMTDMQAWIQNILAELGRPVKSRRSVTRPDVPVKHGSSPESEKVARIPGRDARPVAAKGHGGPLPAYTAPPEGRKGPPTQRGTEENTPAVPLKNLPGQPRLEADRPGGLARGRAQTPDVAGVAARASQRADVQRGRGDPPGRQGGSEPDDILLPDELPDATVAATPAYEPFPGEVAATRVARAGEIELSEIAPALEERPESTWDEKSPAVKRADVLARGDGGRGRAASPPSGPSGSPLSQQGREVRQTGGRAERTRTELPPLKPLVTETDPVSVPTSFGDEEEQAQHPFDRTQEAASPFDSSGAIPTNFTSTPPSPPGPVPPQQRQPNSLPSSVPAPRQGDPPDLVLETEVAEPEPDRTAAGSGEKDWPGGFYEDQSWQEGTRAGQDWPAAENEEFPTSYDAMAPDAGWTDPSGPGMSQAPKQSNTQPPNPPQPAQDWRGSAPAERWGEQGGQSPPPQQWPGPGGQPQQWGDRREPRGKGWDENARRQQGWSDGSPQHPQRAWGEPQAYPSQQEWSDSSRRQQAWSDGSSQGQQAWSNGPDQSQQAWSNGPDQGPQAWSNGPEQGQQAWSNGPEQGQQAWSDGSNQGPQAWSDGRQQSWQDGGQQGQWQEANEQGAPSWDSPPDPPQQYWNEEEAQALPDAGDGEPQSSDGEPSSEGQAAEAQGSAEAPGEKGASTSATKKSSGRKILYSLGLIALIAIGGLYFYTKHFKHSGFGAPTQFTLDTLPGMAKVTFKDPSIKSGLTPLTREAVLAEACVPLKIERDGYVTIDQCLPLNPAGGLDPVPLEPTKNATDVVLYFPSDLKDLKISIGGWGIDLRNQIARPKTQSSVRSYVSLARHQIVVSTQDCGQLSKEFDFTSQNAYKFLKIVRSRTKPCKLEFKGDEL